MLDVRRDDDEAKYRQSEKAHCIFFFLRRRAFLIREIVVKTAADEIKVRRVAAFLFLSPPRRFDSFVDSNCREDCHAADDEAKAREPSMSAVDKSIALRSIKKKPS